MSFKRVGALCAFFLTLTLSTAQAQALRYVDGPVNFPPGSYKGKQFVDNNGCAFVRAGIDGRVNWIPRVTRSRKLLCGLKPTFSGAEANLAQAQSANAPVQITNNEAPAAAAPAPAPAPRVAAAKPAAAPKPAPKPVVAKPAPRVSPAPQPRVIDATPTTRCASARAASARSASATTRSACTAYNCASPCAKACAPSGAARHTRHNLRQFHWDQRPIRGLWARCALRLTNSACDWRGPGSAPTRHSHAQRPEKNSPAARRATADRCTKNLRHTNRPTHHHAQQPDRPDQCRWQHPCCPAPCLQPTTALGGHQQSAEGLPQSMG